MFTTGNVKQLSFQSTLESAEKLSRSTFIPLYDSEFQIEGALTVNAFADNASVNDSTSKLFMLSFKV